MPLHEFRLSTNYRNSAEIYDLAARVAQHAVDNPDLPDAVRRTGNQPEHHVVGTDVLAARLMQEARAALASVDGTIAVVAARAQVAAVTEALSEFDDARLRVLDGLDTKGLEFDAVVVVEPDAIIAEAESGWRTLYVVLTRATQRLTTVGTTDHWREQLI
jgi:DNA helicase IV